MEHASAAAFARFVLQLAGLAAPPALVRDAALAAADEVRHAELCFTLAARISGVTWGPEPLPLDGVLDARSLASVIREVIVEGCIGVASRQLELATDAETRRALERIAEDEARHAELAWRFLRWAIDVGGREAQACARHTFDSATRTHARAPDLGRVDVEAWRAHGRLSPRERDDAVEGALSEVILPCARRALAT